MTATLRWIAGGRITGACPNIVIEETDEFVALYEPAGAIRYRATGQRSGPRGRNLLIDQPWSLEATEWTGDGVVRVHRFGDEWSTWRWLNADGEWSRQFYLNLEDPWRRTAIGFDTGDWILDVVALPDGAVEYKDLDELEWAEAAGGASREWVEHTRLAGEQAVRVVDDRLWPLSADWARWMPPADSTIPALPLAWAEDVTRGVGR